MSGVAAHEALLERSGWEAIPYDGKLLVSHQDALLLGGKVAAAAGYKDHVVFRDLEACRSCGAKPCVEICSGQALSPGRDGVPAFDREKCIHCGACQWSCALARTSGGGNIELRAGVGGLHSSGN